MKKCEINSNGHTKHTKFLFLFKTSKFINLKISKCRKVPLN